MTVAILIPTIDRPYYVLRQLEFYHKCNCKHLIYIGDSSSDKNHLKLKRGLVKFKDSLEFSLFHWPEKNDRQTIKALADQVSEEYCAFIGDDDFFIPSSITKCANFLSKNPDYSTAQGRACIFRLDEEDLYGEISQLHIYWDENKKAEEEELTHRLKNFSKNYWVTQFSIHRTDEFIASCKNYHYVPDRSVAEYLHCFSFIATGKSKFLDCLYLIRQDHPQRGKSSNSPTTSASEMFLSNDWIQSSKIFIDTISNFIIQNGNATKGEAQQLAEKYFETVSSRSKDNNRSLLILKYLKLFIKKIPVLEAIARFFIKDQSKIIQEFIKSPNVERHYRFFESFISSKVSINKSLRKETENLEKI